MVNYRDMRIEIHNVLLENQRHERVTDNHIEQVIKIFEQYMNEGDDNEQGE